MSNEGNAGDTFEIVPLASSLGAEILGVDLHSEITLLLVGALKAAWAEHGVLLFRGQTVDDEAQVRFSRRFGLLQRFRPLGHDGPRPAEIFRSANTDETDHLLPAGHEQRQLLKLNWLWHSDGSYRETPVAGVVLRGVRIADTGGETVFANLRAAYEAMSEAQRHRIEAARVRHSFEFLVRRQDLPKLREDELGRLPCAVHPLVRRHSDGRRSLFLSPPYMEAVLDWDETDARALIDELTDWATQERFLYVHRWQQGDLIMWDNGWTMHKVMPYPIQEEPRIVHGAAILVFGRPTDEQRKV